jgi:tetratricopeptide (TPR) repeat protein
MLAEAEALYRAALATDPGHSGALHGLGLLRAAQGGLDEAIRLLRKAVDRAPRWATAHNDLGAALQAEGRHKQAVPFHRRAIVIEPNDASAHFNLGAALHALGRLDAAQSAYQAALTLRPAFAEAAHNLGDVLAARRRFPAAAEWFARALELGPEVADTHNKLGMALAAVGRRDEAIACFRRAVALRPDHVEAHNNLGGLLHELGRIAEAADAFAAAVAVNPRQADLHSNRAVVLAALQRHEDAAASSARAIALQPDLADAHNNLGSALRTLGRSDAALACFEKAVALRPGYAEALNNLGALLHAMERHDNAIEWFEKALAAKPDYAEAHNNLGAALAALDRPQEALGWFERALAIRPNYVVALNSLGLALSKLHREAEALGCYERALAIDPKYADSHRNMGVVLRTLGRLDEARRALETAIALEPDRIEHYLVLAASKRFVAGDPHLAAMAALARDLDAHPEKKRIDFHFNLAKAYADVGEHAPAFDHLLAGNALKRRSIVYDEAATLGWFERIVREFTPAVMERLRGHGDRSTKPVFIVGMPRAGTTLIEQILASHPEIFGAGEIEDFRIETARLVGPDGAPMIFPELAGTVTGEQMRELGATYLSRLSAAAPTAARVTDKLPLNFAWAGLIHLALPGARIIHVRRNPIDTCLSCFSVSFAGHQPYSYDLGELGRYYRAYEAVMAHWHALLPDGVMLEVRYEDVVDDLEGQARRLVAHCGLPWHDACLAFHTTQRPIRTASVAQVRQPIYRSSVARWKPYEHLLAPLIEALGDDDRAGISPRRLESGP